MLVDPSTGLPIDTGPDPSTLGGEALTGAAERAGYSVDDVPFLYDIASTLPGVSTTTMWNVNRVSNTIVKGGKSTRAAAGMGNSFTQGPLQTLSPRNFNKLTRPGNIDPQTKGMYSPFGAMAGIGNKAVQVAAKSSMGRSALNKMNGGRQMDPRVDAFSRGTFGRVAAMQRMGSLSDKQFTARSGNINNAIKELGGRPPTIIRPTGGVAGGYGSLVPKMSDADAMLARRGASRGALGSTIRGTYSGQMAGFVQGAQEARLAGQAGSRVGMGHFLGNAGNGSFRAGASRGIAAFDGTAGSKLAQRTASIVGSKGAALGMRAAGPIGTILLARDLAMMGGKIVGTVGRTMIEAGHNLAAPLNSSPLDGVYKDNAVAATSRQRGVMAIQSSRLNARSVLGNEAAAMSRHFG